MKTLDRTLERAASGVSEASRRIPDRAWQARNSRQVRRALTPLVAALLVFALVGIPALLLGSDRPDVSSGVTAPEPNPEGAWTGQHDEGFTLAGSLHGDDGPTFFFIGRTLGALLDEVFDRDFWRGYAGSTTWPPTDESGDLNVYEDGTVTVRGDKVARLFRLTHTDGPFALYWTDAPGVEILMVSEASDIAELVRRAEAIDYSPDLEDINLDH